jgi:prophage antirepressor-like protein
MNEIQVFNFEGFRGVRVVIRDGEPWFVAKDVCDILDIKNPSKTLENFPDDEILKLTSSEVQDARNGGWGGASVILVVSEPGLYRLIFQSRKSEAERLKRWVYHEVLPAIRKTGRYIVPKKTYTKAEIEKASKEFFMDCFQEGGMECYLERWYGENCDPRRKPRKITLQERRWLEETETVKFLVEEGRL